MKKLIFTLLTSISLISFGQAPQQISYQGVARNTTGSVLPNQNIGIKLDLHQGNTSGTVVFSESHNKTTNAFGLFTLGIGSANTSGFTAINWANGPYFLEVSMDPAGGTSYTSVGTQQFMSVPYALYAETSGNASATPTITINAPNTVTSAAGSYTINVPAATSYSAGTGIDITGGVISNTAAAITPTIVGTGATTVTGIYPNLTINSPTVAPDQTVSLIGTGNATVTGSYPNFTVNVPSGSSLPNALNGQFLYHTGTIWDTLPRNNLYFDGTNYGIGTTAPQANFHVVGAGRFDASVSTPHLFTNTLTVSGGTLGQVLTSDASGNGTWQNSSINTPTINSGGVANVTNPSTNVYLVDVPAPNISYNSGTNELTLTQNGSTSTATLNGTGSNTVSIVGSGLASVTPTTGSNFTVSVPNPTLSVASGSISISGGNSVAIPSSSTSLVAGNTNIQLIPGTNSYTLNAYTYSLTNNSNTLTLSNGAPFSTPSTVVLPTTATTSLVQGNNITLNNSGNTYTVSAPAYSISLPGGNVVQITNGVSTSTAPISATNLTLNGPNNNILSAGGNTVGLNTYTAGTGIAITGTAPNYTLSSPNQSLTINSNSLSITGGNTITIPTGSTTVITPSTNISIAGTAPNYTISSPSQSLTINSNSLSITGGNTITIPTSTITGTGTGIAAVTTSANNFTVNVPVPGYNPTTGSLSFGTNTVIVTPTLSLTGTTLTSGAATNSVNLSSINNWSVTSGVIYPSALTNSVGVGINSSLGGRIGVSHTSSTVSPHINLISPTISDFGRFKFSNTGSTSYFSLEARNNTGGVNDAFNIAHNNGVNEKQVFLINGNRNVFVNNLNIPLTTFHVMTSTATASGGIASEGFAQSGQLNLTRNNNAGAGLRSAVFGGDELGKINFAGYDGAAYTDGAKIYAKATENVTGSNKGTELIFSAVPTGTNSNKDAFKINGANQLEVISGLKIPLGAALGSVLTSTDALGNASWQPLAASAWVSSAGSTTLTNIGDKVGIGTATPAYSLDVYGEIMTRRTDNSAFAVSGGVLLVEEPAYVNTMVGSHGYWTIQALAFGNPLSDYLNIGNSRTGNNGIKVFQSGNVCIGNLGFSNIANQTLNVFGNFGIINPTTGYTSIFNTGTQTSDISYDLPIAQGTANSVLTNNGSGVLSWQASAGAWVSSAGSTTLTNNSDKVGIGTNAPSETLDVNGNINIPVSTSSVGVIKMAGANFISAPGTDNLFVGKFSGNIATTGFNNVAFGNNTFQNLTNGANNVGLGYQVMPVLGSGSQNIAIGTNALSSVNSGNNNTALGFQAGNVITNGTNNLFLGYNANASLATLTNASAIGYLARVDASNSMVLGSINGINGATTNAKVGIGTTTPGAALDVVSVGNINAISGSASGTTDALSVKNTNAGVNAYAGNFDGGVITKGKTSSSTGFALRAINSSTVELFNVRNDGNVGINVTNPGYRLAVSENSSTLSAIYAINSSTTSSSSAHGVSGLTSNTHSLAAGVYGNNSSVGPSIYAEKNATQTGIAAKFEILNTSNNGDGIFVSTNGGGAAIHAVNGPTVTGGSNVAMWLESGHLKTTGTAPTYTLPLNAAAVTGNDIVGTVLLTLTAATTVNQNMVTVFFNKPYSVAPNVMLYCNNANAFNANAFVTGTTTSSFTITFASSVIAASYSFKYLVIE